MGLNAPPIRRDAVLRGAAVGFAVAAGVILLWNLIDALADLGDSSLVFVFYLVVIGGWVLGGRVAGRRAPDAPYTHGALAGLVSALAIAVVVVAAALARGHDVPAAAMVFHVIVATSAGIVGSLFAGRP